jgi:pimeloyl-ACP methyl ester carboxylesterase
MAMRIDYKPNGTAGYSCQLSDGAGLVVTVHRSEDGVEAEVVPEGIPAQAAVAAVERYGDHEYERRRTRSAEKRKHHAKEAAKWHDAAEDIVPLLCGLTTDTEKGWCSDCLTESDHRLVRSKTKFRTRQYVCIACGSPTGRCDVPRCRNFADRGGGPSERSRFCAEHGHEIPSFEKLEERVASLDAYLPWLEFEHFNARRYSSIAAAAVAGVAVVGPLAFVAAPAIGGAIGAYAGLSGAAATSHGLALLGGGSLAMGGYGMAGGTAVVAAAGVGLGGASGASVANAYVRSDKSFGFEKVSDGDATTVIFANGFLSEGTTGWGEWERIIGERYPDATVYRLTWGAKELRSLTSLVAPTAVPLTVKSAAALAAQAAKNPGRLLGPMGAVFTGAGLAKNPWHVARTRASMTGAVLADAIVRADLHAVVLVGFSLGARVMTAAAESLATRNEEAPRIQSMHLLGAAVGTRRDWRSIEPAVEGRIHNYYSTNDKILSAVYRVAEAGTKAIGCEGIPTTSRKVKNVDVSKVVNRHQDHLKAVSLRSAP